MPPKSLSVFCFMWFVALSTAACEGDSETQSATDVGDSGSDSDGEPILRTERVYVVESIRFPRDRDDVFEMAFEYPGVEGEVNRAGGLTTLLMDLTEGVPVEQHIADGFAAGRGLKAYSVESGALDSADPSVTIRSADVLYDSDAVESPFERDAMLRLADGKDLVVLGDSFDLRDEQLTGSGNAGNRNTLSLEFLPELDPTTVGGVETRFRATIDEDTLVAVEGALTTPEQFRAEVFPGIAAALTEVLRVEGPRAGQVDGLFDLDDDGVVTVEELEQSDQLATLIDPDVDLDGDGVTDHISQSLEFTARRVGGLE